MLPSSFAFMICRQIADGSGASSSGSISVGGTDPTLPIPVTPLPPVQPTPLTPAFDLMKTVLQNDADIAQLQAEVATLLTGGTNSSGQTVAPVVPPSTGVPSGLPVDPPASPTAPVAAPVPTDPVPPVVFTADDALAIRQFRAVWNELFASNPQFASVT